jgi:hypothetical protein
LVDHTPAVLYDDSQKSTHRYTFSANLDSPYQLYDKVYKGRRVPFTVRYRIDPNAEWSWVYHNFGIHDGELILQPPIDPNFLGDYPVQINPGWVARKTPSDAPDARLYTIESSQPIPVSDNGNTKFESFVLGLVLQTCRWMGLVRIWEPWLAPRHGNNHLHLTEPAVLLSFLRSDGLHVVLLAVNGIDDVVTHFKSNERGDIVVEARNDSGMDRKYRILAASAWKFEIANAAVMYEARKLVQQSKAYQAAIERLPRLSLKTDSENSDTLVVTEQKVEAPNEVQPEWLESWYDGLAYCTWNSLGQDLNADKIMNGLDSLAKNNIHIATLIIDDNWQSLDGTQGETNQFNRGWNTFEANRIGFPEGLKKAITKIKETHPAIRDIAVWHALMGYWGGISPEGELAKMYNTQSVTFRNGTPMAGTKLVIQPSDIHKMYDDFYRFLSSAGVTAVKTDAQFALDLLDDTADRHAFTTTYQSAWTQAHLRHLSGKAISCMSMIPQILYHQFLPTNTPRIMMRNSDDFFPDVPTSHAWHVFANAHNSLFVQHLNVLPDWDMFQTSHPYSGFHAAARCLSGGPIYITDTPGQHDIALIQQMTALNPRGQTVILRPSTVGKTMGVYDKYDERGILKIGVYDGKSDVGTGMLGVFNLSDSETSFILPVTKFPGVNAVVATTTTATATTTPSAVKTWIVRSHMSRRITKAIEPSEPIRPDGLLQCTLPVRGYDVWSALPVHRFPQLSASSSDLDIAILGLLNKFTGACAILETSFNKPPESVAVADSVSPSSHSLKIRVQLKALGTLGIWFSEARDIDDLLVLIQGKPIPRHGVFFDTNDAIVPGGSAVLEIDVAAAWEEMGLGAGWSNEVGVEVFLR